MKLTNVFLTTSIFFLPLAVTVISCNSSREASDRAEDLSGLSDFPRQWVLIADANPDASIDEFYVPIGSSNTFLGSSDIVQEETNWLMVNAGSYFPGVYLIKNCKKTKNGNKVSYDFDLKAARDNDTTTLSLRVSLLQFTEKRDDLPAVFLCTTCDEENSVLMVEKIVIDKFPQMSPDSLKFN